MKVWFDMDEFWYGRVVYTAESTQAEPTFSVCVLFYPSRAKFFLYSKWALNGALKDSLRASCLLGLCERICPQPNPLAKKNPINLAPVVLVHVPADHCCIGK